MRYGSASAKHNTGIVLNYRPSDTYVGAYEYYVAVLNQDDQTLKLYRYNGIQLLAVTADVFIPGITLDDWYELSVTILPGSPTTNTDITITVTGLTVPTVSTTIGPISVSNYRPSTGYFGFYADRAITEFGYFLLEEVSA